MLEKRAILESLSLNRTLGHLSLVTTKRKPFDVLAKRPNLEKSRDDWHSFEPYAPLLDDYSAPFLTFIPSHLESIARLACGAAIP
jgi:hypothetical protein